MDFKCPRCGVISTEFIECDGCHAVGCVKCIVKSGGRFVCEKCRSQYNSQYDILYGSNIKDEGASPESALAAMFG